MRDSVGIVNSDSALNVKLSKLVDSFQTNNIDTLLIFSTAYPGYISSSKCNTGMFPTTTFIIWNKDKVTYIKKLKGNCLSEIIKFHRHTYLTFIVPTHRNCNPNFLCP